MATVGAGISRRRTAARPVWLMTFADLMVLMVCFFALVAAYSTVDAGRYHDLSRSLRGALTGAMPLEVETPPDIAMAPAPVAAEPVTVAPVPAPVVAQPAPQAVEAERIAGAWREALGGEVDLRIGIGVEAAARVVLSIAERHLFAPDAAVIDPAAMTLLDRLGTLLRNTRGPVVVAALGDGVPFATAVYRSDWELNAARALAIVHHLTRDGRNAAERFGIAAHALARPEDSGSHRSGAAVQRRIEIILTPEIPGESP